MTNNQKFPYVFVYDPGANALLLDDTKKPSDLAVNQVGVFNADTGMGATLAGAAAQPRIFIAQRYSAPGVGFGVVRSTVIDRRLLHPQPGGYYGFTPKTAAQRVVHIGYDGVDANKGLNMLRTNEDIVILISLYFRPLTRWYGTKAYTHTIVIPKGDVAESASRAGYYDEVGLATAIANYVNGTNVPAGGFGTSHELQEHITAAVVQTGADATLRAGVSLTGKAKAVPAINLYDPKQVYESAYVDFTVSSKQDFGFLTISETVNGNPAQGSALQVAQWEIEAQGYDTSRESFQNYQFQNVQNRYNIRAVSGTSYDGIFLGYDYVHDTGTRGATNGKIAEQFLAAFFVPDGTGAALKTYLDAWVAPSGYAAVTIA